MKYLLLIITLLVTANASAQNDSAYNLHLNNGKVYFQKIYEAPGKNAEDIKQSIKRMLNNEGELVNSKTTDKGYACSVDKLIIDYKKYGYTSMNVHLYLRDSYFGAKAVIDIKDEKYRVLVNDIYWSYKHEMNLSGVTVKPTHEPIEETIVRTNKPEFRKSQDKSIKMISGDLEALFDINNISSSPAGDDNW